MKTLQVLCMGFVCFYAIFIIFYYYYRAFVQTNKSTSERDSLLPEEAAANE